MARKIRIVFILLLLPILFDSIGSAQELDCAPLADFEKGTDAEVLKPWRIPDAYKPTVTRLAVAVVLIEDGTARVLRLDYDLRKEPKKAEVFLETEKTKLSTDEFHSVSVRFKGLKKHTFFRVLLVDSNGNRIVGPALQAGPVHWETRKLESVDFKWPETKSENLHAIGLLIDKNDNPLNERGSLLLGWVGWR